MCIRDSLRTIARAEVDDREDVWQRATLQITLLRAIGGVERDVETGVADGGLDGAHVVVVTAVGAILVLDLNHEHWPSARDLQRRGDLTDLPHVARDGGQKLWIPRTDLHLLICQQPGRQPAQIPFRANVGTGPQQYEQALFLRRLKEGAEIEIAGEVEHTGPRLMQVPEDVGGQRIQPKSPHLLHAVVPVFARHARCLLYTSANAGQCAMALVRTLAFQTMQNL